jgi:hypothetical protein
VLVHFTHEVFSTIDDECEQKTIKPMTVGGVAGGIKYIAHGIFFKVLSACILASLTVSSLL